MLRRYSIPLLIFIFAELLFLLFQARGIFGGDSGDLVTAAFQMGVPHPPGYPLYTFLGWLVSRLSLFSPAWRVGLLSSIPHAMVVSLAYCIVVRLTKRSVIGLFTTLALVGNYLFFLYSVTPEVFALFDFFIVFVIYLLIVWKQTGKPTYLNWSALVLGLSLSHHHVVLFFVPAMVYWVWINKKLFSFSFYSLIRLFAYFFIGLLPYFYIPLAARGNAIVNWDRPIDLSGFIRLITRADYGTFVSGGFYGAHLIERLLQVKGYVELLFVDFSWVGIILSVCGCIWLWKNHRPLFFFFLLALLFFGPAFFFYASFPLFNRFNWGTYERFLLPSYMVLYPIVGLGLHQLLLWVNAMLNKKLFLWKSIGSAGLTVIFFLYPLSLLGVTAWRFVGLPDDSTANNLGRDILETLPPDAIVLVSRDTPLFTSQYVRYALGFRPDVALLHANKLQLSEYPAIIRSVFPSLVIPPASGPSFTTEFIQANAGRPIFSNSMLPVEKGWFWVPYGLLYRLTSEQALPSMDAFYRQNKTIWDTFADPTKGILARYNHLMLSDVRDVYEGARIEFGKTMLKAGKLNEAKLQLTEALHYGGDTQTSDAYTYLGLAELFGNHCDQALDAFAKAKETSPAPDKEISLYEGVTLRDCAKDPSAARKFLDEYERRKKSEETPLR